MICQRCKKRQAVYNFYQSINGYSIESHLCEKCASTFNCGVVGISDEVLGELFNNSTTNDKVCPVCNMTFSQYEKTGLLGCPTCYDVFRTQLLPIIKSIHTTVYHVGKAGKNYSEHEVALELQKLQEMLEAALRERRYSDAQRIDDKIKSLTKKLYGEGGDNE